MNKKILQVTKWLVGGILAIYLSLCLLLQFEGVQRFIADKVAEGLSQKIASKVEIGRLELGIDRFLVDSLIVYDQQKERMIASRRAALRISILDLLRGKVNITSLQLISADVNLYMKNADAPLNIQFLVDSLASKDTTTETPLDVRIRSLILSHCSLRYNRMDAPYAGHAPIDINHVSVHDLSANMQIDSLTDNGVAMQMKKLSFRQDNGFDVNRMSFDLNADKQNLNLSSFSMVTTLASVEIKNLMANYKMKEGKIDDKSLRYKVDGFSLGGNTASLSPYISLLSDRNSLYMLSLNATGDTESVRIHNLSVSDCNFLSLATDATVTELNTSNPAIRLDDMNLLVSSRLREVLSSEGEDKLSGVVAFMDRVGTIGYKGAAMCRVPGNNLLPVSRLNGNVLVGSDIVGVEASSDGNGLLAEVHTKELNMSNILPESLLGAISGDVSVKAKTSAGKVSSVALDVALDQIVYNGHAYRNVAFNADYTPVSSEGKILMDDVFGHVDLTAGLKGDLQTLLEGNIPSSTDISIHGSVRDFSLQPFLESGMLNHGVVCFDIDGAMKGSDITNVVGSILASNVNVKSEEAEYSIDHFSFMASNEDGVRHLQLNSDLGDAYLDGQFDFNTIMSSLTEAVAYRLPSLSSLVGLRPGNLEGNGKYIYTGVSNARAGRNNFSFSADIVNIDLVSHLLGMNARIDDHIYVKGEVNDPTRTVNMYVSAADVSIGTDRLRDNVIELTSEADSIFLDFKTRKFSSEGKELTLGIKAVGADDRLIHEIAFDNHEEKRLSGEFRGELSMLRNSMGQSVTNLHVNNSEIMVGDTAWHVSPSDILYSKNKLVVDHFSVSHNRQHIIIDGIATDQPSDSIEADLKDVDVQYILDFVDFHSVSFDGLVTGKASMKSVFGDARAHADLIVRDFLFESGRMGTLYAKAKWNKNDNQIDIDALCDDDEATTKIDGYVSLARSYIDLDIDADNTRGEFVGKFCSSFMEDVDVRIQGGVHVFGPLETVNIEGKAEASGSVGIRPLGTRYTLERDSVILIPDHIIFKADTVRDSHGGYAVVNGQVNHHNIARFTCDVNVAAHNLLSYDFDGSDGSTFYGTVYANGDCNIHTRSGEVIIDVDATPCPNSIIVYDVSSPDAIGNNDFIHWHDRTGSTSVSEKSYVNDILRRRMNVNSLGIAREEAPVMKIDTSYVFSLSELVRGSDAFLGSGYDYTSYTDNEEKNVRQEVITAESLGVDLDDLPSDIHINFEINATPDVTLKLIMDAITGDYITLNGTGGLEAKYYNKGAFNLFGTYNVEKGLYKMTIQDLIKREFVFLPGSSIVFGGDPYMSSLDLKGQYTLNSVPLSDLNLGNSFAQNNIKANCLMNISGTPMEPRVDFGLEFPTLSSDGAQMIRSVINSEEDMNQQVLYLLAIGRFYLQSGAGERTEGQSQTSLAMQSLLSGTISQQVGNVLNSVMNMSNWNFGANISTGTEGLQNAEYEGLLNGRLLNNRLIINGEFGYRDNINATSSFIGDFDISYLLTPNGNYSVKIYNQTNDRYFTKNSLNTQGLGVVIKRDFNSFKDLFRKRKKLTTSESKK